jgi:hypothetical protein
MMRPMKLLAAPAALARHDGQPRTNAQRRVAVVSPPAAVGGHDRTHEHH